VADSKNHSGSRACLQAAMYHSQSKRLPEVRGEDKCTTIRCRRAYMQARVDSHTRASITSINAGGAGSDSPTPTSTSREAASYRAAHCCADVVEFTHGYDVRERVRDLDQRAGRSLRPRFKRRTDDSNCAVRRTIERAAKQRKQQRDGVTR
jgi:hypothetical protein